MNVVFPVISREKGRALVFVSCWAAAIVSLSASMVFLALSTIVVPEPLYSSTHILFVAVPWIISIAALSGTWLVAYYLLFVVSAIILSFMLLAEADLCRGSRMVSEAFSGSGTPGIWEPNFWVMMPRLLSVSIFVPTVWYGVVGLLGPSPTVPGFSAFPLWQQLFGFAAASFWEEIVFRLFFLGIPMVVLPLRRDGLRLIIRGGEEFSGRALYLVIISSALFAAAHAFGGWDWYKVPPTFFTGLALGYVFVKRGLPGAIILHFSLNYFTIPLMFLPASAGIVVFMFFVMLFCGAYYSVTYARAVIYSLRKRRNTHRVLYSW